MEFIKKDVIKNIDLHQAEPRRIDDLEIRKDFPAIGTTKTVIGGRVQSKRATSLEGAGRTILKTDHISFDPPANERRFQKVHDHIVTEPRYSANFRNRQGWVEKTGQKTVNNRSSVPYNIISNEENVYSGAQMVRILDKKVTNRKKGVAEFYDLTHVSAIKPNPEYNEAYGKNPKVFYKRMGIFTNTYDAAVRNGNPDGPFKVKK
eukprot:TRINITY_DN8176_c0_g2_i1.p1 TRINITY_DN8176_c0_g2~~TRINITY_DN8176_c0_g2_i1.p1  ORF type:complete len:205 (+),score=53.30 TRINITY_DN8176_c0_g2_i1:132-746(+)